VRYFKRREVAGIIQITRWFDGTSQFKHCYSQLCFTLQVAVFGEQKGIEDEQDYTPKKVLY